jgi:(p)ppGpp synthase/HD superfamily hydrolase
MMSIVDRARDLAYRAHAGQVDKAGRPYIEHVARVAERVREDRRCPNEDCNGWGEIVHWETVHCGDPSCCSPATTPCPDCDEAEAVAWLHDVQEDCADCFDLEILMEFPDEVYESIYLLTRDPIVDDEDYYYSIRNHPVALRVKLADIADNSDESRLAMLDEKTAARLRRKYAKAFKALTGGDDV